MIARLTLLLLAGLSAAACAAEPAAPDGTPALSASRIDFARSAEADPERAGQLVFRGGLKLESDDLRFGGLSGLLVSPDGTRALAVSDAGWWTAFDLQYKDGNLSGASNLMIAPMRNTDGVPVDGKREMDAEALAGNWTGAGWGRVLVAFEQDHRIWAYDLGRDGFEAAAEPVPVPAALRSGPANGGMEGIELLPDGRLFVVTEDNRNPDGTIRAAILDGETVIDLALAPRPPFEPTGATVLPSGDLVMSERRFSPMTGVGARFRLIPASELQPGAVITGAELAELGADHAIDNFEGIAARGETGRMFIYVLSDDNYNRPLQATLLLMFEVTE